MATSTWFIGLKGEPLQVGDYLAVDDKEYGKALKVYVTNRCNDNLSLQMLKAYEDLKCRKKKVPEDKLHMKLIKIFSSATQYDTELMIRCEYPGEQQINMILTEQLFEHFSVFYILFGSFFVLLCLWISHLIAVHFNMGSSN